MVLSPYHKPDDHTATGLLNRYRYSCAPHCPEILNLPIQLSQWQLRAAIAIECFSPAKAWKLWRQRRLLAAIAIEQRLAVGLIITVQGEPFTPFFQERHTLSSPMLSLPEDGFSFIMRARNEQKSWGGVDVTLNRLMYCDQTIADTAGREVIEMMTVAQDLNALWLPGPYHRFMQRLNQSMDGVLRHEVYESMSWVQTEHGWSRIPQFYHAKEVRLLTMFGNRLFRFTLGVEKVERPLNHADD
jgi:hypothetical protein